jgi:methionyl-tRNA formyltransferase
MAHVIVTNRIWYKNMKDRLSGMTNEDFILIDTPQDLTFEALEKINPGYVFFPHWSFIIPSEIHDNFECVIFHMTDLPFGRGGSPLQNLIARGIYETQVSAIKCDAGIDSGDVYLKRPLSLIGTAGEIFNHVADVIEDMIVYIIKVQPKPVPQVGEPVYFPRRKPAEGNIANLTELRQVYDYIRMLDADGYPKAFFETNHLKFEFERASIKDGYIISDVRITKREVPYE